MRIDRAFLAAVLGTFLATGLWCRETFRETLCPRATVGAPSTVLSQQPPATPSANTPAAPSPEPTATPGPGPAPRPRPGPPVMQLADETIDETLERILRCPCDLDSFTEIELLSADLAAWRLRMQGR